jgi:hypothetical protein
MTKETTGKCNCTNCWKLRFWFVRVKPEHFRLLTSQDNITDFVLKDPAHRQLFCKICGVHAFHKLDKPQLGGEFWSVSVSCFDDLSVEEVMEVKIRYSDGRNDSYMKEPKEKELL